MLAILLVVVVLMPVRSDPILATQPGMGLLPKGRPRTALWDSPVGRDGGLREVRNARATPRHRVEEISLRLARPAIVSRLRDPNPSGQPLTPKAEIQL
jgi:hypothetical protein